MHKSRFWLCCYVLLTSLLLAGCVAVPDSVQGTSAAPQQDLQMIQQTPQQYVGQEARFGGKVVTVQNLKGKTRLEIATLPLDSAARPRLGSPTMGRIFADLQGFVDPVNLGGQIVTVVGLISGQEAGKIGEADYTYITLNVTGYQRWHPVQQVMVPPQPIDPWVWYGPGYRHRGYWGRPGWGYYAPGPAPIRTILTE